MISPQESGTGMTNEEYARVSTGEKYWREYIANEIESMHMSECGKRVCECDTINLTIFKAASVARYGKEGKHVFRTF